ncbi:Wadjet anti-phage system protein JetD domain-containing protein [Bremerella alba]|uniref:Wadjet protein JetD C-terminal domain-containing protein n=1 Tax=Bremerella alba TaxID=980252 RepID=A0A7V8V7H5_9BACT|nr:Wadjet anti-phage system protein JetD domain-containing protein [Bremerella alba]MBA2116096.1 hypothetical protein [Bremerella alba]
MIRPDEVKQKAVNLYPKWQQAWLNDEPFFPRSIPCDRTLDENLAVARASILALKTNSKEILGYGYTVHWKERNSRQHGKNLFPERIEIESEEDFLQLIGKQKEFDSFKSAVRAIRDHYPQLIPWIRSHRRSFIAVTESLTGLLSVIDYLVKNPRPNCFARELPLPVDTKFVEREQKTLRPWLDLVLPPHAIRADEEHFFRRFGVRYAEPQIHVRFLDEHIRQIARSPWAECSVPLHSLAQKPLPGERVLLVENKINLLTLPPVANCIAIGGLGNSVTDLRYVTWLNEREVWYWGDIDVEGFEILSRLRVFLPETHSMMMDNFTVTTWAGSIGGQGNLRRGGTLRNLTTQESLAYQVCSEENLRVEQERLPQSFVNRTLNDIFLET